LNGGRSGSTAILADGVNNTGIGIARAVVSFSPETVQEFTVQTSAYSAEFGNTGGGTINATTKSGTNTLNGVALWYTRCPKCEATPFTTSSAQRPKTLLRSTQVSFTVGGPIFLPKFGEGGKTLYNGKNKSFFFFSFNRYTFKDAGSNSILSMPTQAFRNGDFSAWPFQFYDPATTRAVACPAFRRRLRYPPLSTAARASGRSSGRYR